MATKKKAARKAAKKAAPVKKKIAKKTATKAVKSAAKLVAPGRLDLKKTFVLYVDSTFFFPTQSSNGYQEISQAGRISNLPGTALAAALPLPVGAVVNTITFYYKNVSAEQMQINILKKHIDHHCYSGEVEVSLDFLPPATVPPDDFAEKVINHFDAGGLIQDKYLYFIEVYNTVQTEKELRTLRGMRIEYAV